MDPNPLLVLFGYLWVKNDARTKGPIIEQLPEFLNQNGRQNMGGVQNLEPRPIAWFPVPTAIVGYTPFPDPPDMMG